MTMLPPPPGTPDRPPRTAVVPALLAVLGCGCGLLLVVLLALGGATWYAARKADLTVVPSEVQRRADQMLPGIQPLPGQRPTMAGGVGNFQGVMFVPTDSTAGIPMALLVLLPEDGSQAPQEASESLLREIEGHESPARTVVDSGLISVRVRGQEVEAVWTVMEQAGGDHVRTYYLILPGAEGRPVMIMLYGPEGTYDETILQEFVDPIR